MAGAVGLTMLGAGYVTRTREPKITLRPYLDIFHVCVRETKTWTKIVAEFVERAHAEAFVTWLKKRSQ